MLQEGSKHNKFRSQAQCLAYLGENFRPLLYALPDECSDVEVGKIFLQKHIFVHTSDSAEKFNCLLLMIEKLYAVVGQECETDNLDSIANQEVLLSGHLYIALL